MLQWSARWKFLLHVFFSFLSFVSEVPTEPVQGNYEAIENMLIIQAKQVILPIHVHHAGLLRKEYFATRENNSWFSPQAIAFPLCRILRTVTFFRLRFMTGLSSDMYDNPAFILQLCWCKRLTVPFPSLGFNKTTNC